MTSRKRNKGGLHLPRQDTHTPISFSCLFPKVSKRMGDDACTGRRRTNGCRSALPTGSKGLYLLPDGYMAGGRARHIGPAGCKHFFFFFLFFEGYSTLFLIHYKTILVFFTCFGRGHALGNGTSRRSQFRN